MSEPTPAIVHEPELPAVELLCERLGELDLPIGPDTAREILRAVLALEAPRMEAHVREALQTSIETVRVAAQAALGVLTSTAPVETRPPATMPHKPVLDPAPKRAAAAPAPPAELPEPPARTDPQPAPSRRPPAERPFESGSEDDFGEEKRPVFRRPRGR
ncbi:MAG: hypothetical protein ABI860_11925 [Gemmatimonadales bacterium]